MIRIAITPAAYAAISATLALGTVAVEPERAQDVTIRKRVGACMWKLKQAGYAREVPIAGELKGWQKS
jgi:hypothetical protein